MTLSRYTKIYSNVLSDMIEDGTLSCEKIVEDLHLITEVTKSSTDLNNLLLNPSYTLNQKSTVLDDIFAGKIDEHILRFLKIIVEKHRFNEFESIVQEFTKDIKDKSGIKELTVFSAIDLSEDNKSKITDKLSEMLHKKAEIDWQIDKSVIAGLVIKIDDNVIDTSIKNKLDKLSKNIIKGTK